MKKLYAEDLPYFMSGKSSPDKVMDDAEAEIIKAGGRIERRAELTELGKTAYLLEFVTGGDRFRVVWHVLESRRGNLKAAKRQAAAMLYHDVKAKCVSARVKGMRRAFAEYFVLPEGITVGDATDGQLPIPLLSAPKLLEGEIQ